jgi:hypothetical protein
MTVEEKIQEVLDRNGALTTVVPASRIRVPGDYQNVARPWISHSPAGGVVPTYTYDGLVEMRTWERYQVSIFADSYSAGRAVADLVRDAMTGNHDGVQVFLAPGGFRYFRELTTKVHQFILEFRIVEGLTPA